MVTVHNLEVRMEVQGEGDEAAFVRLFNKYIRLWRADDARRQHQARSVAQDRSLGDRTAAGMGES